MTGPTVADYLEELAGDLDGVEVHAAEGGHEVVVEGVVVAALGGGAAELRLRAAVATAALRTPDVAASPRGPGWVRFAPATLDGFALDRAAAWLESAIRLATEPRAAD